MGSSMPPQEPSASPVIFISAGEASGEHYGAMLASSLQQYLAPRGERPEAFGMGGPRMAAAGVDLVVRAEDMAVMGITEIVLHLPRIYRGFRKLKRAIRARRPSVAVLIDFPDIHLRLAKLFHQLGIPVIYFVSPQLWAWKQHRIRRVRKYVSRMLVIFPFEQQFYRDRGVAAEFVGHPLAELPPPAITRHAYARQVSSIHQGQWLYGKGPMTYPEGTDQDPSTGEVHYELDPNKDWIALLPGSRTSEIFKNLPEMVKAAGLLANQKPGDYEFIIPVARTITNSQLLSIQYNLGELYMPPNPPRITFVRDARAALHHARASVVASGTATVEAALIGNPFIVVYRVSPVTYAIARRVVKVPHVAMANLIAGKRVVPELIQHDFTAANIVQQLTRLLPDGPARESMKMELGAIRTALLTAENQHPWPGAIERVASIVLEEMHPASSAAPAAEPERT
jgi:lipid-A-disaccharide synthase